jgi:hypothetical protein
MLSLAIKDVTMVDNVSRTSVGMVGWMGDAFGGSRVFAYRKNAFNAAAIAQGACQSRRVLLVTALTGGTTTSATKVGAFGLPGQYVGSIATIENNGGVAPENEMSIVVSNTADTLTFDPLLPFSVAVPAAANVRLVSPNVVASAVGDDAALVAGVPQVPAASAFSDQYWGWFQFQGISPRTLHKSATAVTISQPVVADVAAVAGGGTTARTSLTVGDQLSVHPANLASNLSPVSMQLLDNYI